LIRNDGVRQLDRMTKTDQREGEKRKAKPIFDSTPLTAS
jgi:hypothetical protein